MSRRNTKAGRFYDIDGRTYPSVTSILQIISKPALVAWSAKVEREMVKEVSARLYEQSLSLQEPLSLPQWLLRLEDMLGKEKAHTKELAKAGEIGTQVHALIEFTLRMELLEKVGPSPALETKAQFAYASWQKWRQSVRFKPVMVEFTVVSKKYGYAGTADLLAEVDGVLTLVDWKTGKKIYPESWLQNIAYRKCIEEMGLGVPEQGMILRLPKTEADPDFEVGIVPSCKEELFEAFQNAQRLWKWQQESVRDVQTESAVA